MQRRKQRGIHPNEIKGWINHHTVSDNAKRRAHTSEEFNRALRKWFTHRSQRQAMSWESLQQRVMRGIARLV